MIDFLKQIVDAAGDRIRSPFLGSIVVVVIGYNWRALFYLVFANKPVRARILYFDANTDVLSLLVYPAVLGIIAALLMPWVAVVGAWFAQQPKATLHKVQHGAASQRRIEEYQTKRAEEEALAGFEAAQDDRRIQAQEKRAEKEEAKARLEAAEEQRTIDAAKRLKDAGDVNKSTSDTIAAERQTQSEKIKNAKLEADEKQLQNWKNDPEIREILPMLSLSTDGVVAIDTNASSSSHYGFLFVAGKKFQLSTHKEYLAFEDALQRLADASILKTNNINYTPTPELT